MKTSDFIAVIALVISLLSAAITSYQILHADKEARINATVAISQKFIDDRRDDSCHDLSGAYLNQPITDSTTGSIGKEIDKFAYIAFLANTGRLELAYLSLEIQCGIYIARIASDNFARQRPELLPNTPSALIDFKSPSYCKKTIDEGVIKIKEKLRIK